MTATAYQLAQKLKNITAPNGNDRLARSLNLVHAFAMSLPATTYATAEQAVEETQGRFKDLINEVNEYVVIDTRLTLALYPQVLRIRFELMHGTCDPVILQLALQSESARAIKAPDDQAMTDYLLSRPGYSADQQFICDTLRELHAAAS